MKLLAITSCPVGIAHTYIAAEKLNKMAKKMGVDIKVETQGSTGAENVITEQDIKEADGIIIAADKAVSLERFEGMAMIECPIARAIKEPDVLIQMFLDGKVEKKKSNINSAKKIKSVEEEKKAIKAKQPAFNGWSFLHDSSCSSCRIVNCFSISIWWTTYRSGLSSSR